MNRRDRSKSTPGFAAASLVGMTIAFACPPAQAEEVDFGLAETMSFRVGGGVTNFLDRDTREFTNVGGTWEARFAYGTDALIGGEIAYIGTAQEVDALGLDQSAVLLGSGGEFALRLNVARVPYVRPYALAGIGVSTFNVVNDDFNRSNVDDSETAVHIPIGLGFGFQLTDSVIIDVRGMLRPTFAGELTQDPVIEAEAIDGQAVANLDSWSAVAGAGIEF